MTLRTLRYLPSGWSQGARAGAHLTVSPRASVEGARRVLQRRKTRSRGPPPACGSLMGLLRPHRAVAPAPCVPPMHGAITHDPLRTFCYVFRQLQNAKFVDSTSGSGFINQTAWNEWSEKLSNMLTTAHICQQLLQQIILILSKLYKQLNTQTILPSKIAIQFFFNFLFITHTCHNLFLDFALCCHLGRMLLDDCSRVRNFFLLKYVQA